MSDIAKNDLTKALGKNLPRMYVINYFAQLHLFSAVMVPFYLEWGKIAFYQAMLLQSWFMFCVFILEIPTGTVADLLGRKYSLLLSGAFTATAFLVYSSIPNFNIFMLGEFLCALGVSLASGANESLLYDTLKLLNQEKESKKIFGRIGTASQLGLLTAGPLGSLIAYFFGLQVTMRATAIPFICVFLLCWTLKEPQIMTETVDDSGKKTTSKGNKPSFSQYIKFVKTAFATFREKPVMKRLTIDFLITASIGYFMIWLYQPKLMTMNLDYTFFGYVYTGIILMEIVFMNSFERFEKALRSKRRLLVLSGIVIGLGYIFVGLSDNIILVVLGILLASGIGFSRPILVRNYMNKYIASEQRATVLSATSMFRQFVIMIANPFVGMAINTSETTLNLNGTFLALTLTLGLIIILFNLFNPLQEEELID